MSGLVMVMPYRAYVEKAKEEGYSVYAIWDPEVARGIYGIDSPGYLDKLAATADGFELADFSDLDGLERAIVANASGPEVQYVYHLGAEETMLATYRVAAKLGKAVNPVRSIELLNDKLEMRRLLEREGLSPVRFAEAPSWRAAEPLLNDFPLPLVLKPTSLSGSRGVYLLRDRSQYRDWGQLLDGYGYDGPVLLEEYLKGPEFSVETLSCAGRHRVIGVTKKVLGPPPLFVEMGHVHPFEDEQMAAYIGETAIALLDAAGYMCGPAHTEVIWGPAGPRIVESQARLGGDRIPQLVQLSTGVDMERGIFQ